MRSRNRVVFALFASFVSFAISASGQTPRYQASPFVRTAFDLRIAVDYHKGTIDGSATLRLLNDGKKPAATVSFLLNRLMKVAAVRDAGGKLLTARSEVVIFEDDPFRQVLHTTVTLPHAVPAGGKVQLSVEFGGPVVGYTETGSLYIRDSVDPKFTIIREDAYTFPTLGVPSRRLNRSVSRPDFAFRALVTVPESQTVATGGHLVARTVNDKQVTFEFAGDSVPFLNIAIAPYKTTEVEGVSVYALPEDAANAQAVVDAARNALARLQAWYGPLRRAPQVTVIEIPEGFGSQASLTGGVILDAQAFRDRKQLPQLYHELSHFWNPTDLDRPEPRWNEGLAMYLQYRIAHELDGFAGSEQVLGRVRARVCNPEAQKALQKVAFIDFGRNDMTDFSYTVGWLMFSELEKAIGQEKLDAGLRDYIQSHLESGGTTEQMIEAIGRAAAPTDLRPFFTKWMRTTAWTADVCAAK